MPLLLVFSGCTASEKLFLSSGPVPRVEDCALIQQATPTRYMCGGKTYTSVELTDIRNGKPDKARVTASSSTGVVSLASTASPWRRAVQR
jgi:hypothetical protein